MVGRANLQDGSALLDLQSALATFRDEAHSVLLEASSLIRDTRAYLEERREYWHVEIARREDAYHSCMSSRDEEGRAPNCSAEAAVLQAAEEQLENVNRWCERVDQAIECYESAATHLSDFVGTDAIRASSYLGLKLRTVDAYSAAAAVLTPAHAPSASDHGYAFQKAKQQMLRNAVNDPSLGKATRGWIQQELNRLDRIQQPHAAGTSGPGGNQRNIMMPPGFDAGHRVPGINDPSNLRLELASMNRARPRIAHRLGIDYLYR